MAFKYKTSSSSLDQACLNNPSLKQVFNEIFSWMSSFVERSGIDPHPPSGIKGSNSLTPPPVVSNLSVVGFSSVFQITITPPLNTIGLLYYLVESSETLPFETSITLKQYNVTSGYFEVTQPATSRYWRVKAKFTNSDYGQVFITGLVST